MVDTDRHKMKMVMLYSRDPPRNPKLEKLRKAVLTQQEDNSTLIQDLSTTLSNIHASYLFHPKGRSALKAICTVISSTPTLIDFSSWKDLAGALDLTFLQIGCIENYKNVDFTENVLKAYAIRKDATLGNLVSVLESIQRCDAITSAQQHLKALQLVALQDHTCQIEEYDSGFSSSESENTSNDNIIRPRPEFIARLQSQLFITLREKDRQSLPVSEEITIRKIVPNYPTIIENEIQQASVVSLPPKITRVPKCSKKVMVTFAADGESIARKLAAQFRQQRGRIAPIGVLILDDHRERVMENPEHFIMHYFNQMNYIIPIVTEGYLQTLGKNTIDVQSSMSCIDPQYIQFIHDLMTKHYRHNNCRNSKVRCIIPIEKFNSILNHPHMKIDPVLEVFLYENEIEQLAQRILHAN